MSTAKSVLEMAKKQGAKVPNLPSSLAEALDNLEMRVSHKRKEHDALRLRPHPCEFFIYYDV